MEHFQRIFDAILSNDISKSFTVVIVLVFILAVAGRLPRFYRLFSPIERSGAGLMTTLGVLGTFTGIFIGLLDFNVSQIDSSVPELLEGLKIAFATSIVGMGGAITFKILQAVIPQPRDPITEEATPEDILAALKSINQSVEKSADGHQAALEDVRRAISSDNDSSLLTQVQKLRTSIQDGQQELIKEFREFAETMAENNSEALIEALEQVIRDFNTQLTEQFGENFKQLNEAVGALLIWQENYRDHVETLEDRITAAVEGLELSQVAIEDISIRTATIPETLIPLKDLLMGLRASVTNLEAHLEAVGTLREKALEAFPVIEGNIEKLTTEFGKGVDAAIASMEDSVEEQRQALNNLREGYDELRTSSREIQGAFSNALSEALGGMQSTLEKAMEGHATAVDVSTDELRKHIEESWSKTQKAINDQFETLDEQMQQELTRVLELMGRNLASLSEKFVEDYEPLTNRLREVIQIADRAS